MKAIRVRWYPVTTHRAGYYKAQDCDNNSARGRTMVEAVQNLCQQMDWHGSLSCGHFGADVYYIWDRNAHLIV